MYAFIESVRRLVTPAKTPEAPVFFSSTAGSDIQPGGPTSALRVGGSAPTPPFGVTAGSPPEQVYEVLRADVAKRLRNVCADWSEEDFNAIVEKVTQTALKHLPESSLASVSNDAER